MKCQCSKCCHMENSKIILFYIQITSKKPAVDCPLTHPYLIADCLSRSSTLLMADSFLLDVRKAVQLAVYDWVTINAKNHHIDAHTLVENALEHSFQYTTELYNHLQYLSLISFRFLRNFNLPRQYFTSLT